MQTFQSAASGSERLRQRVLDEVERGWPTQVEFLADLVRCRSVLLQETPAQHLIARKLRSLGLAVDQFDVDLGALARLPGYSPVEWGYRDRPQVVGVWPSSGAGRSLVLNGHVDVVSPEPVRLWTRDPWGAQIEGSRLYGRGACDMKAGLSAMVFAVVALKRAGAEPAGDVILQSVTEEECGGNGTLACLARGYVGDGALVVEPTNQDVVTAEPGVLWLRAVVTGAAGHVQTAQRSVNAIEKAFRVMQALHELEAIWNANPHPAFAHLDHPINFNLGVIRGGDWPSTVPAECEFEVRIGFYPEIDPEDAKTAVLAHLRKTLPGDPWFAEHPPAFTWYGHHDQGVVWDRDDAVIQSVKRVHAEVLGQEAPAGQAITAATDARFWPLYYGKPSTCYGPAGGAMHAPDEYVELPSVLDTTKVIAAIVLEWCGVREA